MYRKFFKRFLDIILSFIAAVVLLPMFLLIALAIIIDNPGSIFFRQKRIGRDKNGEKSFFIANKFITVRKTA